MQTLTDVYAIPQEHLDFRDTIRQIAQQRIALDVALALHHAGVATAVAPHAQVQQRDEQPDDADDHQDDAHRLELDAFDRVGHGVLEDRADGDEEERHPDGHARPGYPRPGSTIRPCRR